MKKIIILLIMLIILTGCGHMVATYSKGAGLELAWNPSQSIAPTIRAGFYEVLLSMNRENTNIRYNTNIGMGLGNDIFGIAALYSMITGKENTNVSSGSGTSLEIKTGPMLNGYSEKIFNNPKFNQYQVEGLKYLYAVDSNLSNKQIHVTPFKTSSNVTPVVTTQKGIFGNTKVTTPTNQFTQEAIKQQVKTKSWVDAIESWIEYIIIGFIAIIVIICLFILFNIYKNKNKNKKIENMITKIGENVDS